MNIFVASLPFNADDDDLRQLFEPYGEVTSSKVIFDRERNRSKGFGFVEMSDEAAGQTAIAELNDSSYEGRTLVVKVAEARPERRERRY
ncbi:MAG: RNA-binding protein [Bacteroidia bacterium]|nr:RNA-binding protein [Bacteroidia bacterium]NNJ54985.1 RNA-binding protein [Bacteroidia bacterium]